MQANLPVNTRGLGIRSAVKLAPSAFMASAASTLSLQNSILTIRLVNDPDDDVCDTSTAWTSFLGAQVPPPEFQHIQKVWDRPIVNKQLTDISSELSSEVDKARHLSASSPHSGDWLMAPPITSNGLRRSMIRMIRMIRIAVGFRLRLHICE